MNWFRNIIVILSVFIILLSMTNTDPATRAGLMNLNNIRFLRWIAGGEEISTSESLSILESNNSLGQDRCRNLWYTGLLFDRDAEYELRDRNWDDLFAMRCPAIYMFLLRAKNPADIHYALFATIYFPLEARSWFWAADIYNGYPSSLQIPEKIIDYELAAQYYQRGLQIDPSIGLRRVLLGHAIRRSRQDISLAINEYKEACDNWNYKQGCYYAGKYSEAIGDLPAAIQYYQLTGTDKAKQRLDELE